MNPNPNIDCDMSKESYDCGMSKESYVKLMNRNLKTAEVNNVIDLRKSAEWLASRLPRATVEESHLWQQAESIGLRLKIAERDMEKLQQDLWAAKKKLESMSADAQTQTFEVTVSITPKKT